MNESIAELSEMPVDVIISVCLSLEVVILIRRTEDTIRVIFEVSELFGEVESFIKVLFPFTIMERVTVTMRIDAPRANPILEGVKR